MKHIFRLVFSVSLLFASMSAFALTQELQLMWKETNLYHDNGGTGVVVTKGNYEYRYMSQAPFSDFLEIQFENPETPANPSDLASEKQGSALTTGKNVGGLVRIVAKPGVTFKRAYAFGKIENGAKDRIAVRYGTMDGNGDITWKENWYPLYYCWNNAYSDYGQLGSDASLDLQEHNQYHGNRYSELNVNVIEFRNVDNTNQNPISETANIGANHTGLFLRNMAITVGYTDENKRVRAVRVIDPRITYNSATEQVTYKEVEPQRDVQLSVTATDLDGVTRTGYTYQWYKCNFLGDQRTMLPGESARTATLVVPAEQQTINGVFYYVCHVSQGGGTPTASKVFCVNTIPQDGLLIHYNLPQSTSGTSPLANGWLSNVSTLANTFQGNTAAIFSNHNYEANGIVEGMVDKISMPRTKSAAVPIVFQFTPSWSKLTRITEIVMEVQPVTYNTEMFYAELDDGKGHKIIGQCVQPTPGVGTLLQFAYDPDASFTSNQQYQLKLYAWDPAHDNAFFRINRVVAIYGRGDETTLPDPIINWAVAPLDGKAATPANPNPETMQIYATSDNSTRPIEYSPSGPYGNAAYVVKEWSSAIGTLKYDHPGVVTITAQVQGDGNTSNWNIAKVSKTIIVENLDAEYTCTTPVVTVTGQNDNNNTRASFCANDGDGIAKWSGFTATATVESLRDGETLRLMWLDSYNNEVDSATTTSGTTLSLTYKPTKVGTYHAVAMVYEPTNSKTVARTAASVQYRLLHAPARPTISGPTTVERTASVTLTATSAGAKTYQWYIQEPGQDRVAIPGATGKTYTWQTNNSMPLGRYYFYCQTKAGNTRNGEELDDCDVSPLSGHAVVRLDESDHCEWHYLLNPEDAEDNFLEVSNRSHVVSGGQRYGMTVPIGGSITAPIDDRNIELTYCTPMIDDPEIDFHITPGTDGTVFMVAKAKTPGAVIYLEKSEDDGNNWTEVEHSSISHERWTTYTSPSLEAGLYRMRLNWPAQIALAASRLCQGDCETNIPVLQALNNGACGSVTLQASDYSVEPEQLRWFLNGDMITESDTPVSGDTYEATENGRYSVGVNINGCWTFSRDIEVTLGVGPVNNREPHVILGLGQASTTVNAGSSYTIPTDMSNVVSYQWYRSTSSTMSNAQELTGSTAQSPSLKVNVLSSEQTGMKYYYRCVGYSPCGQVQTEVFCIEVANGGGGCLDMSIHQSDFHFEASEVTVSPSFTGIPVRLINNYDLSATYEIASAGDAERATLNTTTGEVSGLHTGSVTIRATSTDPRVCEDKRISTSYTLSIVGEASLPVLSITSANHEIINCAQPVVIKVQKQNGSETPVDYSAAELLNVTWYYNNEEIVGYHHDTLSTLNPGSYRVEDANGSSKWSQSVSIESQISEPHIEVLSPLHYYRDGFPYTYATGVTAAQGSPIHDVCRVSTYNSNPLLPTWRIVEAYAHRAPETKLTNAGAWVVTSATDPTLIQLDMVSMRERMDNAHFAMLYDTVSVKIAPIKTCATTADPEDYDQSHMVTIQVVVVERDIVSIAYVVDGIVNGDFVEADPLPGQEPLYEYLDARPEYYRVAMVNGDADFVLGHYSAYDAVVISPQLNTQNVAAAAQLNALSGLLGNKPLVVLNGGLGSLSSWQALGYLRTTTGAQSPEITRLAIHCDNHPIFQRMSNKASILKNGYVEVMDGTAGQTLLGFSNSELKPYSFARVAKLYGDNKVGLSEYYINERHIDTRLVLLPMSQDAAQHLTNDGKELVHQCIQYIFITHEDALGDCGFRFTNGSSNTGDGLWKTSSNWAPFYDAVPVEEDKVVIEKPCRVDATELAIAQRITLADDSVNNKIGSIIVSAGATLVTNERMRMGSSQGAVSDPERLHLESNATSGSAAFIHNDVDGVTKARVDFYSKADGAPNHSRWQWITTPFRDVTDVIDHYYGAWLYEWNATNQGWTTKIVNGSPMTPFGGYTITQASPTTYSMTGTLVPAGLADYKISLAGSAANTLHIVGNSWTAPIEISRLDSADFENLEKTIWLFNTGLDEYGTGSTTQIGDASADVTSPGTYLAIPIHVSNSIDALKVIPAMQGFQVKATGTNAALHLHYDNLVRVNTRKAVATPARIRSYNDNVYMGDQERDNGVTESLRIVVRGSHYVDALYLLRHPDCTDDYEDGYDGEKILSNNYDIPMLFTANNFGWWQVSTQSQLTGTTLGFFQGEDNSYTLSFEYDGAEPLWLYDSETNIYTGITNNATYTFASDDYAPQFRFLVTDHNPNEAPNVSTGIVDVREQAGNLLFTNTTGNMMQISIYDVMGRIWLQQQTISPLYEVSLPDEFGVYMVFMKAGEHQETRKVVRE